jgi:hypothetical protein
MELEIFSNFIQYSDPERNEQSRFFHLSNLTSYEFKNWLIQYLQIARSEYSFRFYDSECSVEVQQRNLQLAKKIKIFFNEYPEHLL